MLQSAFLLISTIFVEFSFFKKLVVDNFLPKLFPEYPYRSINLKIQGIGVGIVGRI